MPDITLISTVHKENGKCNADELLKIIEAISPNVIFLEAFESTYTDNDKWRYSEFGVYHHRLELKAIQKYCHNHIFEYEPVLDVELGGAFDRKYNLLLEHTEYQKLMDSYSEYASRHRFQFLNSSDSIKLHEEMRSLERELLQDNEVHELTDDSIDAYENSMLQNILNYCKENTFNTGIFMCGSAHRKSITKKIESQPTTELNWRFYGN